MHVFRDLDAASWAVVLSPTRDMTPSGMKLCMECGALKELTEFRKDGLRHGTAVNTSQTHTVTW